MTGHTFGGWEKPREEPRARRPASLPLPIGRPEHQVPPPDLNDFSTPPTPHPAPEPLAKVPGALAQLLGLSGSPAHSQGPVRCGPPLFEFENGEAGTGGAAGKELMLLRVRRVAACTELPRLLRPRGSVSVDGARDARGRAAWLAGGGAEPHLAGS